MIAVSYSRADLFESCPFRFKKQAIDKVPERKNVPLMLGSLLHDVHEKYVQHLLDTKQQTDHQAFGQVLDKLWAGRSAGKDYPTLPETLWDEIKELSTTLRTSINVEPTQVIGVELRVAVNRKWEPVDWFAPGVWLRGVIDRLECSTAGRLKVWDLKTGFGVESDPIQQKLYAPLAKAEVPEAQDDVDVELYQLRFDSTVSSVVGPPEALKAVRWIESVSANIDKAELDKKWPATPGPRCSNCPVFDQCPARAEAKEFRTAATEADAQALLRRLVLLDTEVEKTRQALRGWVESYGPVRDGGAVAKLAGTRMRSYNPAALMALLRDAKVLEPLEYFNADNRKVDKLAMKDRAFGTEAEKLVQTKVHDRLVVQEVEREETA